MSIRYECPECGSVLKIKDSLAGTDGKCPKCKTPFVVPTISSASAQAAIAGEDTSPGAVDLATVAAPASSKPKGRAKIDAPPAKDAEFDPVAFLMEGGAPPKSKTKSPAPVDRGGLSLDDGGSPAQPAAPKARSQPAEAAAPTTPPPATAAASARGMLSASSNAKDLLTRTVEESRARAAEMPEETKVPFIDTAQLRAILFTRILPYGGGLIVFCGVLFWISNSLLGTSNLEIPDELVAAEGVVLINGERTEGVVVTMRPFPDEKNDGRRWRASQAVTNDEGEFEMIFLDGYEGVVPGKQQVSLSYIVDGRETVMDEFYAPGLVMDINESTYDLELKCRAQMPEPREAAPAESEQ